MGGPQFFSGWSRLLNSLGQDLELSKTFLAFRHVIGPVQLNGLPGSVGARSGAWLALIPDHGWTGTQLSPSSLEETTKFVLRLFFRKYIDRLALEKTPLLNIVIYQDAGTPFVDVPASSSTILTPLLQIEIIVVMASDEFASDKGWSLARGIIAAIALGFVVVSLRVVAKLKLRQFGVDDVLMGIALVCHAVNEHPKKKKANPTSLTRTGRNHRLDRLPRQICRPRLRRRPDQTPL